MSERILIVEDDADMRELLEEILAEDFEIVAAANGRFALAHVENEQEQIDLIVTDVQMPELKGDELLMKVRERRADVPVIVITAFGSVENAVEMVKKGAYSYLTKPFATKDLLEVIRAALKQTEAARAQARLRREIPASGNRIVGASRPMRELLDLIGRAGRSTSNILITGESGTGKELVARAVHDASARNKNEFVAVNCAAIPSELVESELFGHTGQAFTGARAARAGLFETADGGTLFLDEIGELPLSVQPKLLRVLQEGAIRRVGDSREKQVNARLIAATNRDLEKDVADGRFREDLYWRVNVIQLHVPPLRARAVDVPLLVEHFLAKNAKKQSAAPREIAPEALALLTAYSWQGNVRELENTLERAIALAHGAVLMVEDFPERIRAGGASSVILAKAKAGRLTLEEMEREYILEILREANGNKSRAAEMLGLDRKTLYRKLDEYRHADSTLDV